MSLLIILDSIPVSNLADFCRRQVRLWGLNSGEHRVATQSQNERLTGNSSPPVKMGLVSTQNATAKVLLSSVAEFKTENAPTRHSGSIHRKSVPGNALRPFIFQRYGWLCCYGAQILCFLTVIDTLQRDELPDFYPFISRPFFFF